LDGLSDAEAIEEPKATRLSVAAVMMAAGVRTVRARTSRSKSG
jgi:hypothetical protein